MVTRPATSGWRCSQLRANGQNGAIVSRRDQPATDALAFEFLGDLGVDQGQPVPAAVVNEFGQVPAGPDLEPGPGLVVDNRIFIAHAAHRPIRGGRTVRRAALSRPGRRLWRRDARRAMARHDVAVRPGWLPAPPAAVVEIECG